jgi:resuscitation-promoting factor RpfB
MTNYQQKPHNRSHCFILSVLVLLAWALTACLPGNTDLPQTFTVKLQADGSQVSAEVSPGDTVQNALDRSGLVINPLDRVDPPGYTVLSPDTVITIVRVREEFEIEETIIPFDRQIVRNESLPEKQERIIQLGVNGTQQVTYRQVYEDDQALSRTVFKAELIKEPRPEIVMIGVQRPFTPISISGRIVYLSGGNAWAMEGNTGSRRPLVTTGDLDGYVFRLSPDKSWLLFTRKSTLPSEEEINTLWMVKIDDEEMQPVNLRVSNIVHFADWVPGRILTIAYSTVEPRATAPGWQANNDLWIVSYASTGMFVKKDQLIEGGSGGTYGWWGTTYAWSPDGTRLAYARPDGIGLVDLVTGDLTSLVDILPYQTGGDWAWVTGISWSPVGNSLYLVTHSSKPGLQIAESSPIFDLSAIVIDGPLLNLGDQSGMFSYPVTSPVQPDGSFRVAYLKAIFPELSETGRYRLAIFDRDGSNEQIVFPAEDMNGLKPQPVVWSPEPFPDGAFRLAVLYDGNLYLIDPTTREYQQITGDGLIQHINW